MIRLVVCNQRGGVAKTTTATTVSRVLADKGMKVLLIDTDSQGSVQVVLGLKTEFKLYDFLIDKITLREVVKSAYPGLDVVCSDRRTQQAEDLISTQMLRELAFKQLFGQYEDSYDAIILDVAPSLSLFQACGMCYAKRVLVPVAMETLSVQGAAACIQTAETINELFNFSQADPIRTVGLLPVNVDRRLQMTDQVLAAIERMSAQHGITQLPAIRTDSSVPKSQRSKQFLADFDPKSRALADYITATDHLLDVLEKMDGKTELRSQTAESGGQTA